MPHRWGMAVDLDRCTGCEACVTACHAENNIPIVGPAEAARGRAMHWIRIERYWEGEFPDVRLRFRPVMCQQCDAAPCEPVCPTYASHHTDEGLNAQVYNRCIGTRYCANACPYNVRFFNFGNPVWERPLELALNPDVSVREVGVVEKCTFCIQRINALYTKSAFLDNPDFADGYIGIQCKFQRPLPNRISEIEEAYVVWAGIRAVARTDAAVVYLRVQSFIGVVARIRRADRLAGSGIALLAHHRPELDPHIGKI